MSAREAELARLREKRESAADFKTQYEARAAELVDADPFRAQINRDSAESMGRLVVMLDAQIAAVTSGKRYRGSWRRGGLTG